MDLHNKNILIIEDDNHIFTLIKAMLKPYNVNLEFENDGEKGFKKAQNNNFDLIILDIMLPGKDGWAICRELKAEGSQTPIIMLTAKGEETDKVLGLEIGADDYVTKPFSPRELTARIKAVLRRTDKQKETEDKEIMSFPELELKINVNNYEVYVKNNNVTLTPKEFELLVYMAQNQGQVFTRKQLLNQVWGFNNYTETRTIDEHIKRLRKKLSESGLKKDPLQTVWGVGYKFETGIES
ncbi:MAG: response regulator transcription factor [Halanaerobium sp.]